MQTSFARTGDSSEKSDMSRRMVMPYCGYEEHTITHPHFDDKPVDVFAIILVIANQSGNTEFKI